MLQDTSNSQPVDPAPATTEVDPNAAATAAPPATTDAAAAPAPTAAPGDAPAGTPPATGITDTDAAAFQQMGFDHLLVGFEIGRASCGERVCQSVYISGVAVSLKKKK